MGFEVVIRAGKVVEVDKEEVDEEEEEVEEFVAMVRL